MDCIFWGYQRCSCQLSYGIVKGWVEGGWAVLSKQWVLGIEKPGTGRSWQRCPPPIIISLARASGPKPYNGQAGLASPCPHTLQCQYNAHATTHLTMPIQCPCPHTPYNWAASPQYSSLTHWREMVGIQCQSQHPRRVTLVRKAVVQPGIVV